MVANVVSAYDDLVEALDTDVGTGHPEDVGFHCVNCMQYWRGGKFSFHNVYPL
jgi:hypothetical protein